MTRPFDIQLAPAELTKLLHAYRTAKNYLQRLHVHVLLLLDDNLSVAEVQAVTFAEEAEVAKAVRLFREGGVARIRRDIGRSSGGASG
jgi:hypothetical protein